MPEKRYRCPNGHTTTEPRWMGVQLDTIVSPAVIPSCPECGEEMAEVSAEARSESAARAELEARYYNGWPYLSDFTAHLDAYRAAIRAADPIAALSCEDVEMAHTVLDCVGRGQVLGTPTIEQGAAIARVAAALTAHLKGRNG